MIQIAICDDEKKILDEVSGYPVVVGKTPLIYITERRICKWNFGMH